MAKLTLAERMNQDFNVSTEGEGVPLRPDPPTIEEEEEHSVQNQEVDLDPDAVVDEETVTEEEDEQQDAETVDAEGWAMKARDFAHQTGLSRKELYNNIEFPTDKGEQSLSRILDDYNSMSQQVQQLSTERHELQEQARRAEAQMSQPIAQEAQALSIQADMLQRQYENMDWNQIAAAERADIKGDFRDQIDNLRRQAQSKQMEWQQQFQEHQRRLLSESSRETVRMIPDWNDQGVYAQETTAMTNFLRGEYGYLDDEIRAIAYSPKAMKLVRDAWRAITNQKKVGKGAKKIRKLSKTLGPSARQPAPKATLADVGKKVREAGNRHERQRARLTMEFDRPKR